MSTFTRGRRVTAHLPWRAIAVAVSFGVWLGPSGPGHAVAAASDPGAVPDAPTLVAEGAFGRVEGLERDPGGPVPSSSDMPVLDAWARGTEVVIRPTVGTLAPWRATAEVESEQLVADPLDLGTGDGDAVLTFAESGLYLVRVDATIRPDGGAHAGTWWWRVAVPDRDLPADETGPPPPALVLASGDHAATLEQGSGCFLGTCGDIGRVGPPEDLPTVRTIPGAPVSLTLADGSGMTDWWLTVRPTSDDRAEPSSLGGVRDTWTRQAWVAAPGVGDWTLQASVTFDRDRGHFDGYGRLIVRSGPPG
jgi:hypothetical protein